MLSHAQLVGFIPSTDLGRSRDFYGGVLGLRVLEENPATVVFDAGSTPLRVTLMQEHEPAPYTIMGWRVEDIAATTDALLGAGVHINRYDGFDQDERGIWTAPSGTRVVWFADPDENNLSLEQAAA